MKYSLLVLNFYRFRGQGTGSVMVGHTLISQRFAHLDILHTSINDRNTDILNSTQGPSPLSNLPNLTVELISEGDSSTVKFPKVKLRLVDPKCYEQKVFIHAPLKQEKSPSCTPHARKHKKFSPLDHDIYINS